MRQSVLILLLSFITASWCPAQSDEYLKKLVSEDGQAEVCLSHTGPAFLKRLSENVSVSKVKGDSVFARLSPLTVDWFIDQKYPYRVVKRHVIKPGLAKSSSEAMLWDTYPSYDQYLEIIKKYKSDYPALCDVDTIGTSINGKLILALKISDNVTIDEAEPEVFYSSTMHGDETAGYILMLRLAEHILSGYNADARLRNLADELEIWINPLANPDGTYRFGNTITNPVRFNMNGYDLNRNFPDPSQPYGPGNVMQKETIDMVRFLRQHRFVLSANFHSGAEVVNYPWDIFQYRTYRFRDNVHADDSWFYGVSRRYADMVHLHSPQDYMNGAEYGFDNGVTMGADWYSIQGGRQDFVTWELQGREVTIELDEIVDYPYVTPAAELPLLWEYNFRSLLGYLENALYGVHGKVTDALTNEPVAAKIVIPGHDRDSSHVYSDTLSGKFTRLIDNGLYDITFSARGYRDTVATGISVSDLEKTTVDIKMEPDSRDEKYPVLYPNPVTTSLKVLLNINMTGKISIKIYNISGILVSSYEDNAENNIPLNVRISGLAGGLYTIVFSNSRTGYSARGKFVIARQLLR